FVFLMELSPAHSLSLLEYLKLSRRAQRSAWAVKFAELPLIHGITISQFSFWMKLEGNFADYQRGLEKEPQDLGTS
ncbi:hypothetical protein HPP92_029105, partial [Vanilla planifolia]